MSQPVYQIVGDDCQVLNCTVREGDEWVCEPGTMMHKSPSVRTDAGCGGCGEACGRYCSGESAFKVTYTNRGQEVGYLGLTPNFPAKIIPLDLSEMDGFHCRQGYYMCHFGDVHVSITCDTNCLSCCCGGTGEMVMQKMTGTGTAFVNAGGTILTKNLAEGESLQCDSASVIGWQAGVNHTVKTTGGCLTMCCSGEGMFNTLLTGPGMIMLMSFSVERYKECLVPLRPKKKPGAVGGE
jgi:uncharacterized protein (AIM24 family)